MILNELLAKLSQQGVKLWADEKKGDQLGIRAPKGVLTPELQKLLAEHKAEILSLLRETNADVNTVNLPSITPCPQKRYEPFPLTDMQHAFWVGRNGVLELGSVANHGYYEIEGNDLNLEQLNWALQKLIERHDMLRAVVLPDGQQQVLEKVPLYQIEVLDLREQEEEIVTSEIETIRQRMSHQVLPADQWPLFEFRATRLNQERVRLHISYDLQVFDAWSLFRLFDEWFQLYQNPEIGLKPLELTFRDYVLAEQTLQNTELYKRSQEYWFSRLGNFPPAPDLPIARNPSELKQHRCKRYDGRLDQTEWQQLKQRATAAGLTASGVLLAAFAEILTFWSKNPQFTINLALFNRLPLHHQVNDIIGDFTSTTLLTVDNSTPESFTDRCVRLQQQLWRDLEHRYISGVRVTRELARRKGTAPSAMPVVFTSTLGFSSLGQETLTFSHFGELVYGISQASQAWMDVQVWEEKGELTFNWDVVEELFPEGLIADMFEAYCRFLNQLAISEPAWLDTSRQLIPPAQLQQRDAINGTFSSVPDEMLHTLFAKQVQLRGNECAVISSERSLTYQELYELSNQLGHRLRHLGTRPNQLIAVVMEKGWEQIVAVLGILASGAAYVPIDPEVPLERLWFLLENSEAQIVLTQSWLNERLDCPSGIQRLCIDQDFSSESKEPLRQVQTPDDLAYVIYTSGSTGFPKGVMIAHRGAVNAITQTNQFFNIGASDGLRPAAGDHLRCAERDRVLALTALNHDMSVYDIFGTLAAGGTIVIPDAAKRKDPAHWAELMRQESITIWNSVPAMMEMLLEYVGDRSELLPKSLRWAFLGGDWISVTLPDRLQTLIKDVRVVSVGGPTETTLWNIWYLVNTVNPAWKSIPYGKPIANAKYYVLNEALENCPTWVLGELCCSGIGLAKGYWRNEEKTHASFLTHPRTGERIYRTGDLGRYLSDGNIEFLGRKDFQVKIRGHRIEVGEIEAALTQHPAVRSAVVTAVGDQSENKHLVAHVVPDLKNTSEIVSVESADHVKSQQIWKSIVDAGLKEAQQVPWQSDIQSTSDLLETTGRLHTYAVCQALKKLGVYNSPGEKYDVDRLISQCGIVPRYRKWLYRALKALVKEGWLQQHEELFESLDSLPSVSLSELKAQGREKLHQVLDFNEFESQWLDFASENLAEVITEDGRAAAQIYANENIPLVYQKLFPYCNDIAKQVIKTLVQTWSPEKELRILEVGAGLGVTTVHLLPLLPPENTTYVFTDISNYFLQNASKNFAAYPFVSYGLLDLEKTPQQQGYELHSFDVIIASSVLHDTRYTEKTLRNLCSLLAPSGLLLMIEETQFHQFYDLNMGLQQGFDVFEDEDLRQVHPLLSKEQWQTILAKTGFEESVILNKPNSLPDFIGFDVFVAKGPSSVKRFSKSELQKYLQQKLPEYMMPSVYVLWDALALSKNGKIDRIALQNKESLFQTLKAAYVAPQNDIEKALATIWQEVLELESVGVNDNFFDIGGDSLLITKVYNKIRKVLSNEVQNLELVDLFKYPTIKILTKHLNQEEEKPSLQQQSAELKEELKQGKNRLKQRLQKSEIAY